MFCSILDRFEKRAQTETRDRRQVSWYYLSGCYMSASALRWRGEGGKSEKSEVNRDRDTKGQVSGSLKD